MRKLVPLFVSLMLPLGAWAQSSPNMDAANQAIISTCKAEGGTFISYKDDKCEYSGCAYVGKNGDVSYDGDNQRVSGGCNLRDYQKKAKDAYKAEIDKKIKELEEQKKNADKIGKRPGDGSVEYGDLNGDGVIDDKDRAIAEERMRGGTPSGSNGGNNSSNGSETIGVDANGVLYCSELEGNGEIRPGDLCYNECKPRRSFLGIIGRKKEGFERKKCVECLLKYPSVYTVKKEFLPKDKNGKIIGDKTVNLGKGVTVKTGEVICRDSKGNIVTRIGSGCPTGMVIHTGGTPSGSGNGNVTVISPGSNNNGQVTVSANANGNLQLPAVCSSTKKKDKEACSAWISANSRFLCASSANPAGCMTDYGDIMSRYSVDGCINCGGRGSNRGSTLSGVAEIVGAVAGPLAHFGSAWVGARAYQKGQEAWAGAATAGFEQCRLAQGDYLSYLQANELPGMTPDQRNAMNCNGYGLGGFAGLGGAYGGYYGAGYTPGFIGGMMGPYGMYNPYGMGGMVGGAIGGSIGGIGLATGMVGGGMVGGMYPGYAGGMYTAGMAGGYVAGGYVAGGYAAGMAGGYVNGAYMGGYPMAGGIGGGLVNGISLAGGVAGGMYPGMAGGMYTAGMAGGMYTAGMAGGMYTAGMAGGMYLAGGMNGGMYPGGMYPGGWGSGAGQWGGGYYGQNNNYYASQQAANIDGMLQQQGMAYQMGQMGGMSGYGGFGGAGMYPSNMGMGLGLNLNLGGGMYGGF